MVISMVDKKYQISVCICTYKRLEFLEKLLSKLENQDTEGFFEYTIVIVDNDKAESARQTVEAYTKHSNISISYYVEPEQNISLARNKAIENAKGDLIALIDDDEFPENSWLLNFYKALEQYHSDGVLGPVLPYFEIDPPKWVIKGHFFDRPTHTSGQILSWKNTRTGNALLKRSLFDDRDKWFDPAYGSGGEDRDFFRRKIAAGYVFVWSNEASVFETVPHERWDRRIMVKRALLRGKMALNSANSKGKSIITSIIAILVYSTFLPLTFIVGQHVFMKYLIKNCDHIGKIAAFFGINLVNEKYVGV
jgi:succinoglycan biosynthesis protein ExoM